MPSSLMKPGNKCSLCVRIFKWFPVVFITAIVAWSYYAYIIQLCFFTADYLIEKILYFIIFHALFIVFVWAYWQTIFTSVAEVPREFRLSPSDAELLEREPNEENQRRLLERYARNLPVVCRALNGAIRYCEKCHHIKPDRAHHCSVCGTCVLKMDHHCPWVNNCVSFTNYKYFILFLGYALLYCLFIAATTFQYFLRFWTSQLEGIGRFHILFLFFVAVMFAISLVSLFGYHCYLVSVNRSTLESFRAPIFVTGPDKDGFNLGKYKNFVQIFGEDRKKWFLPVHTSFGDGVTYPTRIQPASSYNSMESTAQPSVGNGTSFPQRKVDEDSAGLLNQRQHWIDMPGEEETDQQESIAGHLRNYADPPPPYEPSYPV